MFILGIHDGHGAGAALVRDGNLISSVSEFSGKEKGNRIGFPYRSIHSIFRRYHLTSDNLEAVILPRIWGTPFLSDKSINSDPALGLFDKIYPLMRKFNRFFSGAEYSCKPVGIIRRSIYTVIFKYTGLKTVSMIRKIVSDQTGVNENHIKQFEHHLAHAAAAYGLCPNKKRDSLIFTADGEGDLVSATVNVASENGIICIAKSPVSSSLGYFYMESTAFLGLRRNTDEGLVMKMAGKCPEKYKSGKEYPEILDKLRSLIWRCPDNQLVFRSAFDMRLLGYFLRDNFTGVNKIMIAAAVQQVLEENLIGWVNYAVRTIKTDTVCFGGGIALNSYAMKKISELPGIRNFFVCPDPGDGSLATGAAYAGYFGSGDR
jgi:carbamoyltransferase